MTKFFVLRHWDISRDRFCFCLFVLATETFSRDRFVFHLFVLVRVRMHVRVRVCLRAFAFARLSNKRKSLPVWECGMHVIYITCTGDRRSVVV